MREGVGLPGFQNLGGLRGEVAEMRQRYECWTRR
jgi:hypothetical protein